jgi:hypothetical protein
LIKQVGLTGPSGATVGVAFDAIWSSSARPAALERRRERQRKPSETHVFELRRTPLRESTFKAPMTREAAIGDLYRSFVKANELPKGEFRSARGRYLLRKDCARVVDKIIKTARHEMLLWRLLARRRRRGDPGRDDVPSPVST